MVEYVSIPSEANEELYFQQCLYESLMLKIKSLDTYKMILQLHQQEKKYEMDLYLYILLYLLDI